jgi:hypothetical protein
MIWRSRCIGAAGGEEAEAQRPETANHRLRLFWAKTLAAVSGGAWHYERGQGARRPAHSQEQGGRPAAGTGLRRSTARAGGGADGVARLGTRRPPM